ncbi:MAG: hypothetical protein IJU19_03205 [Bacteroidales bacterium]|nr:hypothetical protein [Bacteroidales bacterium]
MAKLDSAPTQATTASPATGEPLPRKVAASRLAGAISINLKDIPRVEPPKVQVEVKPLTQADLEKYWEEAAAELNLQELLKDGKPSLGEQVGVVVIDAQTTHFHEDFRPHSTAVMQLLRQKSGMKMLECKVNQLFVERDARIYSPDSKYEAMLQTNSNLATLRRLMPDIDF